MRVNGFGIIMSAVLGGYWLTSRNIAQMISDILTDVTLLLHYII